jgi:hypothetical protein
MRHSSWAIAGVMLASAVIGSACASSGSAFPMVGGDAGVDATHPAEGGTKMLGQDASLTNPDGAHDTGPGAPHGCDVSCMAAGGTCANNACTLRENPGSLTAAQEQALQAGGSADPSFKWLYPYDQTVFPRGLIPPTLQFAGTAPDGFLVHITYSSMNYTGYFAGSNPARLQLSAATWTAITQGAAASDTVVVAVTKLTGTQASGPTSESWSVAQGNMRGQIYYETYGSAILGGPASVGIMSIAPGATKPTMIASGCGNVCHTASADGSTLVSATSGFGLSSISYDLKTTPASTLFTYTTPQQQSFVYAGLFPDGSFAMSATDYRTWLPLGTGADSHLYDTKTGAQIAAPGWDGKFTRAGTNSFSPDGQHFAFNRNDLDDGAGHTLAVADFSVANKTFSNAVNLTTDVAHTLAWPAFTPDSASVVYHAGIGGPVDGGVGSGYETDGYATGDVYRIDVATRTPARLNALDGYSATGTVYLPDNDAELSFAPTVLPEAVGGFYWVVFTSHRSYGNTLPSQDNGDENGKLWVAAIDENPAAGKDSSHPAFYLDGQESGADNLRGFWVLPPCKQDGNSCGSGDECCTGFCRPDGEAGAYSCVPAPAGACSNEFEKCTQSSDCCEASAGYACIGGYCAAPPPK